MCGINICVMCCISILCVLYVLYDVTHTPLSSPLKMHGLEGLARASVLEIRPGKGRDAEAQSTKGVRVVFPPYHGSWHCTEHAPRWRLSQITPAMSRARIRGSPVLGQSSSHGSMLSLLG